MDIFKITATGIICAVLAIVLKKDNPSFALVISIASSLLIMILLLPKLSTVLELLKKITVFDMGPGREHVSTVIKIIGIAYAAEFGAQICSDAGENSIASKIELGGKVLIMALSAPIVLSLLEQVYMITP